MNYQTSPLVPTKHLERRNTERKTPLRFAYINIEPGNGGSVLNVSEGGLCFQAIAPIQRTKTIRFWFGAPDRRIEVQGELVWTNEALKRGGVRFTDLPAEARDPMRLWISPPAAPAIDQVSAMSDLPPYISGPRSSNRPDIRIAGSLPLQEAPRESTTKAPLTTFTGGVATGLLVAALLAAPFLFHSYKRQLGESLIQWGERFASRPQAQTQSVQAPSASTPTSESAPQNIAPEPRQVPAITHAEMSSTRKQDRTEETAVISRTILPPATPISATRPEGVAHGPTSRSAESQTARVAASASTRSADSAPAPQPSKHVATIAKPASVILPSAALPRPNSNLIPIKPEPPQVEAAVGNPVQTVAAGIGASSRMFFELGKFKDGSSADQARDKLTRLGLHASVVEKSHFWANSYHVLVGPFDDDNANSVRAKLLSSGFSPQVFERGSRSLRIYGGCDTMSRLLHSERATMRSQMPAEDCLISWESYSTHALVKFAEQNSVVTTADGKWVNRQTRFQHDAFVYRNNHDGSRTLLEIQFAGMNHALVFGKS
ncbi:MAG TPA: PilZ domain-containing protein [Terriglobales bacterium]|jgi:hypothetical protein|nr:PilZ domain-containing protein [Terriglobales bacterium]